MADDNSQAAAPIDLSAGLVPKTGRWVSLSQRLPPLRPHYRSHRGLVEKSAPPGPRNPQPVGRWTTRLVAERPADSGETDWPAKKGAPPTYKGPVEYALRKGVGSVAEMIRHPLDTANAAGPRSARRP